MKYTTLQPDYGLGTQNQRLPTFHLREMGR